MASLIAEIYRDDPPHTQKPVIVHTFVFGGPAGFGTLECLPDGSLFVAIGAGLLTTSMSVAIGRFSQTWRSRGRCKGTLFCSRPFRKAVVPTQSASQAATALDVARNAQAAADAANHTAEKARADAQAAAATVNKPRNPESAGHQGHRVEPIGDRINHEVATDSALVQRIEALSQERLLAAIDSQWRTQPHSRGSAG